MPNTGVRLISRNWRWPRLAAGLTAAVAIAAGVAAGAFFVTDRNGSAQAASTHQNDPAGAVSVKRRDLVETDTESGTLSYANPQTVYNGLSGTITWLPSVGQVIKPGHLLLKVNEQPVILMNGTIPAYRDLGPSDTAGADIKQLNRDLVRLGFNPDGIVVDGQWQAATTAGVDEFQVAHHMTETGTLTLGQTVFLPGAQMVGTLDATIGSGGGGAGSGSNSNSSSSSSSSSSSNSGSASSGGNAQEIMQTSSTQLVATVDLDASKQSEAKVGEKVTVEMPNGSTVHGVIAAVSPVAQSSSGSTGNGSNGTDSSSDSGASNSGTSSGSTIPVTIRLSGRHSGAGLDQAAVSVNFAQARAKNVLSVPVTALVATSGNSYAVQVANAPHKLIPVTVGLFSAGYVQVSGSGIYPGLEVTDSQG